MKVRVKKRPTSHRMACLDAWFLWSIGRMSGEVFERVCLKYGQERSLIRPGHGKDCPSNGEHPGIHCRCDNCDYFLRCFPEWLEPTE